MCRKNLILPVAMYTNTYDRMHVNENKFRCQKLPKWPFSYIWSPSRRVEEKDILLIHLIFVTCGREGYPFYTPDLLHVWKRKLSFWYILSPSCVEEKGILLIHLISFTCGRERYPFDTSDLLHVWKRKVSHPLDKVVR